MECIRCGGKTQKHGKTKNGSQRFKCVSCNKMFNENTLKIEKDRKERYEKIKKMYIEDRLSTTEIGNVLGVNSTVPQRILESMGLTRNISDAKRGKKLVVDYQLVK